MKMALRVQQFSICPIRFTKATQAQEIGNG
jgi:hypothetical protein